MLDHFGFLAPFCDRVIPPPDFSRLRDRLRLSQADAHGRLSIRTPSGRTTGKAAGPDQTNPSQELTGSAESPSPRSAGFHV